MVVDSIDDPNPERNEQCNDWPIGYELAFEKPAVNLIGVLLFGWGSHRIPRQGLTSLMMVVVVMVI
jgi:hypothetical protein